MNCSKCGAPNAADASFCGICGNNLKENYIKEYINLVEINLTIEQLEILIDENKKEYNDLNDNELKLYEVIKKEYKSIEIVE